MSEQKPDGVCVLAVDEVHKIAHRYRGRMEYEEMDMRRNSGQGGDSCVYSGTAIRTLCRRVRGPVMAHAAQSVYLSSE